MRENSFLGDTRLIALIASAAVGDTIIRFSFTDNAFADLIGLLIACLLSIAAIVFLKWGLDFYKTKGFKYKPLVSSALMLIATIPLVWTALSVCSQVSRFIADVMLDGGPRWFYFISFLVLGLLVAFSRKDVTLKLGIVLFPVIAAFVILILIFSAQFMNIKYIMPYKGLSAGSVLPILAQVGIPLMSVFIPALTLGSTAKKRQLAASFSLASAVIILSALSTLLIFGAELASTLDYPYAYSVSTASLGHIFSRMDGFLYAVCFFSCFLKLAVCLLSVVILVKRSMSVIFFQKN